MEDLENEKILIFITISFVISCVCWTKPNDKEMVIIKESYDYGSNHAIELFVKYENNISAYSFIFSKEANEISLYIDRNTSFKRYNMYSTPKIHHVILRLCHNANIHYAIINLF